MAGENGALEWEAGENPKAREMESVFGAHQVAQGSLRQGAAEPNLSEGVGVSGTSRVRGRTARSVSVSRRTCEDGARKGWGLAGETEERTQLSAAGEEGSGWGRGATTRRKVGGLSWAGTDSAGRCASAGFGRDRAGRLRLFQPRLLPSWLRLLS